jgi:hypothetical protein
MAALDGGPDSRQMEPFGPFLTVAGENTTRYKHTNNFEVCGHAQCKQMRKFAFCTALRPNQIEFKTQSRLRAALVWGKNQDLCTAKRPPPRPTTAARLIDRPASHAPLVWRPLVCGFSFDRASFVPWCHLLLDQSSSASRFTAGAFGFLLLIQWRERPEE